MTKSSHFIHDFVFAKQQQFFFVPAELAEDLMVVWAVQTLCTCGTLTVWTTW